VLFTGQLTQSEIAAALEKSHIFVSASKMEVQSLVVIEALASGTPVVGLSNETVDELVDASNGIWLPKNASPREFAAAVQHICELSEEDYHKLCENARRRVCHLDWSSIMEKTLQGYFEISEQKRRTLPSKSPAEALQKYLAQLPGGRLQTVLSEALSNIPLPLRERPSTTARVLLIAGLNMGASVIGYYALKGVLLLLHGLRKGKD
jgi:hypothetical protein